MYCLQNSGLLALIMQYTTLKPSPFVRMPLACQATTYQRHESQLGFQTFPKKKHMKVVLDSDSESVAQTQYWIHQSHVYVK